MEICFLWVSFKIKDLCELYMISWRQPSLNEGLWLTAWFKINCLFLKMDPGPHFWTPFQLTVLSLIPVFCCSALQSSAMSLCSPSLSLPHTLFFLSQCFFIPTFSLRKRISIMLKILCAGILILSRHFNDPSSSGICTFSHGLQSVH
jgi:hypothetical protein